MSQKSSQFTKKECIVRKRKPLIAGAGVKHRVNCLSTLSTLHSHSSSCSIKRNRTLGSTMAKPTGNTSKKRVEQSVIILKNQKLTQQLSKSGAISLNGDQDSELQSLTIQQKVKLIIILLMIPSSMFLFFNNKFKSDSNNMIVPNIPAERLAAMGGLGGFGGGFDGGFGGGFGGGGYGGGGYGGGGYGGGGYGGGGGRPPHHRAHEHSRRNVDRESIRDHLNRLDPRIRRHIQNSKERTKEETDRNENRNNRNDDNAQHNEDYYENFNDESVNEENAINEIEKSYFDELNKDEIHQRLFESETDSDLIRKLVSTKDSKKEDLNERHFDETKKDTESMRKSAAEASKRTPILNPTQEDIEHEFKIILLWKPFSDSWNSVPKGSQVFIDIKCPINKCTLTSDKLYVNQSDAIVFEARNIIINNMPNMRSFSQRWVFFSMESPHNLSYDLSKMSNLFNWSWTYRRDSDIVFSHANVQLIENTNNENAFNAFDTWRTKSKMIFWIANNCETQSKREVYVNELKKYIDIDIFGKCGNNSCPESLNVGKRAESDCFKEVSGQYLFAIVFENSYCEDYVSEQVFEALEHSIIPIVMSGANYSRIMPPNSVINAINYTSPKDFADYILDIGSDFNKYKTFFEWKRLYEINYRRNDFCQLCEKLHEREKQSKSYADIKSWWLSNAKCKQWNASLNTVTDL